MLCNVKIIYLNLILCQLRKLVPLNNPCFVEVEHDLPTFITSRSSTDKKNCFPIVQIFQERNHTFDIDFFFFEGVVKICGIQWVQNFFTANFSSIVECTLVWVMSWNFCISQKIAWHRSFEGVMMVLDDLFGFHLHKRRSKLTDTYDLVILFVNNRTSWANCIRL